MNVVAERDAEVKESVNLKMQNPPSLRTCDRRVADTSTLSLLSTRPDAKLTHPLPLLLSLFFSPLPQQCEDKWGHLCALADFAIALNESIQEINKHSFNNFELRIGKSGASLRERFILFLPPLPFYWSSH